MVRKLTFLFFYLRRKNETRDRNKAPYATLTLTQSHVTPTELGVPSGSCTGPSHNSLVWRVWCAFPFSEHLLEIVINSHAHCLPLFISHACKEGQIPHLSGDSRQRCDLDLISLSLSPETRNLEHVPQAFWGHLEANLGRSIWAVHLATVSS